MPPGRLLWLRSLRQALAWLALLLALPATAAELVLYAEPDFRGPRTLLRDETPALDRAADFNDRTRSVEVQGGVWQVCVDADFRGECALLRPGRYARLDRVLDGRISSARPMLPVPNPPPPGARAEIVLYDDADFQGRQRALQRDERNLDRLGFNDRARSIWVRAGRWEICRDADFGGGCQVLLPGEYRRIESRWDRRISSVRPVGDDPFAPPPPPLRPPAGGGFGVSTCTAAPAGACAPCSVTCSDGRRAVCSPGSMGETYGCIEPAVCRCGGRP